MFSKNTPCFGLLLMCLFVFFSCENDNDIKRSFNGLVLNELSCETGKEWIEIKNTSSVELDLGGVYLLWGDTLNGKQLLYTIPNQTLLAAKAYLVIDKADNTLNSDIAMSPESAFSISLVSPYNDTIDVFDRDQDVGVDVIYPYNGSYARIPDGTSWWETTRSATKGTANHNKDLRTFDGLILNEICATSNTEWIETRNISDEVIDISGVKVTYKNDQNKEITYYIVPENSLLDAGAYLIFDKAGGTLTGSFPMNQKLVVSLLSPKDSIIDTFDRDAAIGVNVAHYKNGSYARIPDQHNVWMNTLTTTKGTENIYAEPVDMSSHNGIWMWKSHFGSVTIPTFQMLKDYGIGHLIVSQSIMTESANRQKIDQIRALGMKVHLWYLCFDAGNGWINPIILDEQTNKHVYNQPYFDELIQKAVQHVQYGNIDGIHLDCVRYPGNAYKSNYSSEGNDVTGENAITEFCRQMYVAVKAVNPNIKMSAAVMPETSANAYYYGQNTRKMSKYIEIFMPMVYRYNYNSSVNWIFSTSTWFANEVKSAMAADPTIHSEVWTGLQTYSGDNNVVNLPAADLETDCRYALRSPAGTPSGATGVVLFRYGLINYFDFSSIYY